MIFELSEKTKRTLESIAKEFKSIGVDYVGHFVRSGEKETVFFSHKEWHDLYVNQGVKAMDPYTNFALSSKSSFFMWDHVPLKDKESQEIVKKRSDLCHIGAGMTFYSKFQNTEHIFALASSKNDDMSDFIKDENIFKQVIHLKSEMIKEHSKDHELKEKDSSVSIPRERS